VDTELVVLHFETPDAAQSALRTIGTLEAEGFLKLEDSAIITRTKDGTVTAKSGDEHDVTRKVSVGGILGLVVGGLMGVPVLGLLAGTGVAAKRLGDAERLDELISSVGQAMTVGSGVLALSVIDLNDAKTVTERLEIHLDSLVRAEIPAALRAELERNQPPPSSP
jgi:uncharacterized membrane protein